MPRPHTVRFQGACEDLKEHVFDTSSSHASIQWFTKTTKAIAEYVFREYTGQWCTGLPDMALLTLTAPIVPDPVNVILIKLWKLDVKEYRKELEVDNATWTRCTH